MKNILWYQCEIIVPDLSSSMGNGTLKISSFTYYEYMYKLSELLKLAEEIRQMAENQGLRVRQ